MGNKSDTPDAWQQYLRESGSVGPPQPATHNIDGWRKIVPSKGTVENDPDALPKGMNLEQCARKLRVAVIKYLQVHEAAFRNAVKTSSSKHVNELDDLYFALREVRDGTAPKELELDKLIDGANIIRDIKETLKPKSALRKSLYEAQSAYDKPGENLPSIPTLARWVEQAMKAEMGRGAPSRP